jgi:hypothetical protein
MRSPNVPVTVAQLKDIGIKWVDSIVYPPPLDYILF